MLISCSQKEEIVTTIKGEISPFEKEYILLKQQLDIDKKTAKIIDTLYVEKGKFSTTKKLDPNLYILDFGNRKKITLAFDKGQEIQVKITNFNSDNQEVKITGSKDTDFLLAYEDFRAASLDRLVKSVRRKVKIIKESEQPNTKKIQLLELEEIENYKTHLDELNDFVQQKMESSIAIYATSLRWKGGKNLPIFKKILTKFENEHPNIELTRKLKNKVERIEKTTIGSVFGEVKMNSNLDKQVSLYDVHKKYTLIDFWASWCGPCRTENYMLKKMYKKHQSSGFEIYNISLDRNKTSWLKAIDEDQRNWSNVTSLKGFKSTVAYDYNITALPSNFLIDENYQIIGINLHGKELEKLMNRLFNK